MEKKVKTKSIPIDWSKFEEGKFTDDQMYFYLKDHIEEQGFNPVRLPFIVELDLVNKYLDMSYKMLNIQTEVERYAMILNGEWPNSIDILDQALALAKKSKNEKV
jgi:hypothetical protein